MTDLTSLVTIVKTILMIPFGIFIAGWIVQIAARHTVSCFLPLGRACLITLAVGAAWLFVGIVQALLDLTVMKWMGLPDSVLSFLFIFVGFFASAAVYGRMVKPNHWALPIGFRKGMLVALIVSTIEILATGAVLLVMGALFGISFFAHRQP